MYVHPNKKNSNSPTQPFHRLALKRLAKRSGGGGVMSVEGVKNKRRGVWQYNKMVMFLIIIMRGEWEGVKGLLLCSAPSIYKVVGA